MQLQIDELAETIKCDPKNSARLKMKMFAVQENKIRTDDKNRSMSEFQKKQQQINDLLNGKKHKERVEYFKELASRKHMKNGMARLKDRKKKYFYEVI